MNTHAVLRRSRIATTLVAIGVVAASTSVACSSQPSEAEKVALDFTTALNAHDAAKAASLTTDAAAAQETINDVFKALGTDSKFFVDDVSDVDGRSTATISSDWTLNLSGQKHDWRFQTTANPIQTQMGWKVGWDPAILVPKLAKGGSVAVNQVPPAASNVVDRNKKPLMVEEAQARVILFPGADTNAVAGLLGQIDPTITTAALDGQLAGANGQPIPVATLSDKSLGRIGTTLAGLNGVMLLREPKLSFADPRLASGALSELSNDWSVRWMQATGFEVDVNNPGKPAIPVGSGLPKPVSDVPTTLDVDVHAAAEAAVNSVPNAAAVVAMKPSTGEILALAQNGPADAVGTIATNGLYPPGSTFKMVTSYAALKAGTVTSDTVVACPGQADIKGRTIPNEDNFDLGNVPLHTAFAKSCNTTFAQLAGGMKPDALTNAATDLGLGVDFAIPGITTVTGSVPKADDDAERVEDGIGQGKVTASPFGMAMVAASIANCRIPTPVLIAGQPGTPDQSTGYLEPKVCDQIRTMMRETITGGTATDLNDIPGLIGKTGTAEYGDGHAHGWFVGIVGDMAFAVLVVGADSNSPAKNVAGQFLRALNH